MHTNQVIQLLLSAVSSVVLPQSPHEDHTDQANQKDDHHERIEDGEPVNLQDIR